MQILSTFAGRGLVAVLLVSIALNVVALTKSRPASAPVSRHPPLSSSIDAASASLVDSDRSYSADLQQRGLTTDEVKALVLRRLESRAIPDSSSSSEYWESDMDTRYLESELASSAQRDGIRAALVDLYGHGAEGDPMFAALFQPLARSYGFLPSAEQLAFQRYQIQRRLEQIAQSRHTSAQVPSQQTLKSELSDFLSEHSVAELLYRYSPVADLLRSADIGLTQSEYRQAFQLLERLESDIDGPTQYLEVRSSLRRAFGSERFTRLWMARDPIFAAMETAGEQSGLSAATILSAYRIVNDAQDVLAQAALHLDRDPDKARADIQAASSAQTEQLAGLVGPELTQRLLAARAEVILQIETKTHGGVKK